MPPMPAPAEPKGPAMWEEVLKNPTVKSGINTGDTRSGATCSAPAGAGSNGYPPPSFL